MAVPTHQDLMLPVLALANDGSEQVFKVCLAKLDSALSLNEEDRKELIPSGKQTRFYNRYTWAVTYLKKAGLLVSTGSGRYKITDRGRSTLSQNIERIDNAYLMQFEEFVQYKNPTPKPSTGTQIPSPNTDDDSTPEERIQAGFDELRASLRAELLEAIASCSPEFFERLVVQLLVSMGYGGSIQDAGQAIGKSGDGGIDGVIKEDKLGLDRIYLQAKRWSGSVGSPEIQKFAGSLEGANSQKGVFLTTSTFTPSALDYVKNIQKRIILLDGNQIADLMIDHGLGVSELDQYVLCRLDNNFFETGI